MAAVNQLLCWPNSGDVTSVADWNVMLLLPVMLLRRCYSWRSSYYFSVFRVQLVLFAFDLSILSSISCVKRIAKMRCTCILLLQTIVCEGDCVDHTALWSLIDWDCPCGQHCNDFWLVSITLYTATGQTFITLQATDVQCHCMCCRISEQWGNCLVTFQAFWQKCTVKQC